MLCIFFFFQAEDGIRDFHVTGVQTCALPISRARSSAPVRPPANRGRPRHARRSEPKQPRGALATDRLLVAKTPPKPPVSTRISANQELQHDTTSTLQFARYDQHRSRCLKIVVSPF